MAVTTYRAANFQDNLTLNMPGGTGLGNSTWTLNQSTANLPSGTFRFLVYTSIPTFVTTREIGEATVTGANTISVTLRNAEGDTPAVDHPNGSVFAVVNTAGMENAQNEAIADLYSINSGITAVVSGNAWTALQVIKTEGSHCVKFNGQWLPSNGEILLAASTGSGSDSASTAYKAGTVISGFGGTLTAGAIYYSDSSANLTTTPGLISIKLGVALTTSSLYFKPEISSLKYEPGTSGSALTAGQFVYTDAAGKWQPISNTAEESGWAKSVGVVLNTVGATDTAINVAMPGQLISGLSGIVAGTQYFTGTSGGLAAVRGKFSRSLGIARSTTQFYFAPLQPNQNYFLELVVAGENWAALAPLYYKKSDQRYYNTDSDGAESGICEWYAMGFEGHAGGAGSSQLVYMPGSIIKLNSIGYGAGDRLFPGSAAGSLVGNTPTSYDTFYRNLGVVRDTNCILVDPKQLEFVPAGIQEKGKTGCRSYASNSATGTPASQTGATTNFKKIMVNTPSSITLTATATTGSSITGVAALDVDRFGFLFIMNKLTGDGLYSWSGTYQTVGN